MSLDARQQLFSQQSPELHELLDVLVKTIEEFDEPVILLTKHVVAWVISPEAQDIAITSPAGLN
jgi:hypothetical protein